MIVKVHGFVRNWYSARFEFVVTEIHKYIYVFLMQLLKWFIQFDA